MPNDSTPAMEIKSLRVSLGMVQEAFATELEVAQGVVSAWERGEYAPAAENYANLLKLAAKHKLHSKVLRFFERMGTGRMELVAATSRAVKESRSKWDAAYAQGLIDAQAAYPEEKGLAHHRFATRFADRALARMEKRRELKK